MTKNGRRNVAVKVDDAVHVQLGILAQLEGKGTQIPDVIRQAIDAHLAAKRAELAERSADVLATIDQEAEARRAAVAALVSQPTDEPPKLEVVGDPAKDRQKRAAKATT